MQLFSHSLGLLVLLSQFCWIFAWDSECPRIKRVEKERCCSEELEDSCKLPRWCRRYVNRNCPDRKLLIVVARNKARKNSNPRRAPVAQAEESEKAPQELPLNVQQYETQETREQKCGTAESHYAPCTTRGIADKLFTACCQLYVPEDCHYLCTYETEQIKTRRMLLDLVKQKRCSLKYLSTILYCASQNRDNRKCCEALDLNAPQLQIGSRCLRMCDPSGTSIERITKDDVTCLYNWNVVMYCAHSGITEM